MLVLGAYPKSGALCRAPLGLAPTLLSNLRLVCNKLFVTHTLAFWSSLIDEEKSFITLTPGADTLTILTAAFYSAQ